jgi:hypothetical protein
MKSNSDETASRMHNYKQGRPRGGAGAPIEALPLANRGSGPRIDRRGQSGSGLL